MVDEGEISELVGEDKFEQDALIEWGLVADDEDEDEDEVRLAPCVKLAALKASTLLKLHKLFKLNEDECDASADWKCGNDDDKK